MTRRPVQITTICTDGGGPEGEYFEASLAFDTGPARDWNTKRERRRDGDLTRVGGASNGVLSGCAT